MNFKYTKKTKTPENSVHWLRVVAWSYVRLSGYTNFAQAASGENDAEVKEHFNSFKLRVELQYFQHEEINQYKAKF